MKILKISALVLLGLLLLGALAVYLQLKSIGIIQREDFETVPPAVGDFAKPTVLIFNKVNGFVHEDALPAADAMFADLAEQQGWDAYLSNNGAVHNAQDLAKFKLVIWNNVSGDVLTQEQKDALKNWVEQGGGWLGVHGSGGDPSYRWDWYVQKLVGAQFVGHTMDPQFQDAQVNTADGGQELTAHLPTPWAVPQEEWYAFEKNPRDTGSEIVLTLDEKSYITKGETMFGNDSMSGEHPIAWRHTLGSGRAVYSAIGHQAATYDIPEYREFMVNAMRWAAGE